MSDYLNKKSFDDCGFFTKKLESITVGVESRAMRRMKSGKRSVPKTTRLQKVT